MPDFTGSLDNYQRALVLRQQVAAADVHDARAQDLVTRGHLSIGHVLRKAGRPSEAISQFQQALTMASRLHTADAANLSYAERLANVYGALTEPRSSPLSAKHGRAAAAPYWHDVNTWAQKSLDLWETMARTRPLSKSGQAEVEGLRGLIATSAAALR